MQSIGFPNAVWKFQVSACDGGDVIRRVFVRLSCVCSLKLNGEPDLRWLLEGVEIEGASWLDGYKFV